MVQKGKAYLKKQEEENVLLYSIEPLKNTMRVVLFYFTCLGYSTEINMLILTLSFVILRDKPIIRLVKRVSKM